MTRDFTLEDIGNLINASEARMLKKLDEKFDEAKYFTEQKFQEAKDCTEERFHWLGTRMDTATERLEDKIDAQGIQMRNGFRDANKKIDSLARNHITRIELLEENVF